MGMIKSRRRVMMAQGGEPPAPTPTYGGITVYEDNCYFAKQNGKVTDTIASNDFFLAGPIDTGNNNQKSYTITRFGSTTEAAIRYFNDLTANSVDYWTIWRSDLQQDVPSAYSFGSVGRYIVIPIKKSLAADFYLMDANGNYLVKGSNVT